ncbi:hypothetical protein L798_06704 [Zootermopsis nevadensis]|uniref:Uncharacterized protein n=1 Tax=Zootermopsis nevadensis TaxID=136037 RepID=A0A067RMJ1_ZOONE|nr:hypothetical protein L798_06704 [Zootermopsis nevadensis]
MSPHSSLLHNFSHHLPTHMVLMSSSKFCIHLFRNFSHHLPTHMVLMSSSKFCIHLFRISSFLPFSHAATSSATFPHPSAPHGLAKPAVETSQILRLVTIAYKTHSFNISIMISPSTMHIQNRASFLKYSTPSLRILVQISFVNVIHISVLLLLPCYTLKLLLGTFHSLHQSLCYFEISATATPLQVLLWGDIQYLLLGYHDSSTYLIINKNWHIFSFTFMPFQMDLL